MFVEVPVDLLYPEETVREWYIKESGVEKATGIGAKALGLYIKGHLYRQFHMPHVGIDLPQLELPRFSDIEGQLDRLAAMLRSAEKPALVVGSQTMVNCRDAERIADALRRLGVPVWLGGTARGLLGRRSTSSSATPAALRSRRPTSSSLRASRSTSGSDTGAASVRARRWRRST